MTASLLIALLPPPELSRRMTDFRARHGIRDAAAVPHITVKARSGLGENVDELAARIAQESPPVQLTVGGPRLFPNGSALYLTVQSPAAVTLHLRLLEALVPAARFGYEGPHMQPHLTLALKRRGLDLPAMLADAQAEFADLEADPLTFTAHELTLMRKAGAGGAYAVVGEWRLGEG